MHSRSQFKCTNVSFNYRCVCRGRGQCGGRPSPVYLMVLQPKEPSSTFKFVLLECLEYKAAFMTLSIQRTLLYPRQAFTTQCEVLRNFCNLHFLWRCVGPKEMWKYVRIQDPSKYNFLSKFNVELGVRGQIFHSFPSLWNTHFYVISGLFESCKIIKLALK